MCNKRQRLSKKQHVYFYRDYVNKSSPFGTGVGRKKRRWLGIATGIILALWLFNSPFCSKKVEFSLEKFCARRECFFVTTLIIVRLFYGVRHTTFNIKKKKYIMRFLVILFFVMSSQFAFGQSSQPFYLSLIHIWRCRRRLRCRSRWSPYH